jgi:hypothetical protein
MYNRGINSFYFPKRTKSIVFLSKLSHYLNEICEVYTYCSMQHHFLFLSKSNLKSFTNLCRKRSKSTTTKSQGYFLYKCGKRMDKLISRYNQSHTIRNRHSALIQSSFKRLEIDSDDYLKT